MSIVGDLEAGAITVVAPEAGIPLMIWRKLKSLPWWVYAALAVVVALWGYGHVERGLGREQQKERDKQIIERLNVDLATAISNGITLKNALALATSEAERWRRDGLVSQHDADKAARMAQDARKATSGVQARLDAAARRAPAQGGAVVALNADQVEAWKKLQ